MSKIDKSLEDFSVCTILYCIAISFFLLVDTFPCFEQFPFEKREKATCCFSIGLIQIGHVPDNKEEDNYTRCIQQLFWKIQKFLV
jgi:hypothetical protein